MAFLTGQESFEPDGLFRGDFEAAESVPMGERPGSRTCPARGRVDLLTRTIELCASLPRRAEDIQALIGRGRSEAYRHIAKGIDLGLLDRVSLLRGQPALIVATADGHSLAASGLPVVRLSPGSVTHAAACSGVAVELASRHPECDLISDAELRRDEALAARPIASAGLGDRRDGQPRLHRPDLVLLGEGRPTPIEVELSPKAPQRLLEIVRAWRRASHVEEVVYLCAPGLTQRAVEAAVKKAHAHERVRVIPIQEVSP